MLIRIIALLLILLPYNAIAGFERIDIAGANEKLNYILIIFLASNILDETSNNNSEIGKYICNEANGASCYSVDTIGEGICRAGNGTSCYSVDTIAEGICRAGKGISCYSVDTIPEAICRAGKGTSCYSVDTIAEAICRAGKGTSCYSVNSFGEGICRAGGGLGCYSVKSPGEGICRAGGGNNCISVRSIEDGFDRISGKLSINRDTDNEWDWDLFYDQNGKAQWRCRGVQTGRFTDDDNCIFNLQIDDRWPN